jgi:LmbE family N-acetylglucosaminyl deacetylase
MVPGDQMIRVIAFGAHPDDCESFAGGTAALFARLGHEVKFVSTTNGDAGHHKIHGPALAARRLDEAREAARRLGVQADVLDSHDGQLVSSVETRLQIIRLIREWKADVVMGHRPNDYHPDHRNTGVLLQDAAYLVCVPALAPEVPPLRHNPLFLYFEDGFQRPNPFRPDIAVAVDETVDEKVDSLDAHVSQFYEWLPWIEGNAEDVPERPGARKEWLKRTRIREVSAEKRAALVKWYGPEKGNAARHAEAFEICEYGAHPNADRIRRLFPMLG